MSELVRGPTGFEARYHPGLVAKLADACGRGLDAVRDAVEEVAAAAVGMRMHEYGLLQVQVVMCLPETWAMFVSGMLTTAVHNLEQPALPDVEVDNG